MEMTLRTIETLNITLTVEERMALKKADEVLFGLQRVLEAKDSYIMALETGEIIDWDDVARARGVVGGIADYSQWTFEEK